MPALYLALKKMITRYYYIAVLILLVVWDMLTKYALYDLRLGSMSVWLEPHFNTGIARSLPVPMILVIMISIWVLAIFVRLRQKRLVNPRIAVIFLAGLLGNLIDRIRLGWVRDFISIGTFPIFNIADILLNIGVVLFFIEELCTCKKPRKH